MHPLRKKRLIIISLMVAGIATATGLALYSFSQNLMFFYSPSEVVAGKAPDNHTFRVGGMVLEGSVKYDPNSVQVSFTVTDYKKNVTIHYDSILPDLFREGQGIIALGKLNSQGEFIADDVLAKHDEKYMPPEVQASLDAAANKPDMQSK